MKRSINNKIRSMALLLGCGIILLLGVFTYLSVKNIRDNTTDNLNRLNEEATGNAADALTNQMRESIHDLASIRAQLVDSIIERMQFQTQQVAMTAADIYSNRDRYLAGAEAKDLPVDTYKLTCELPEETLWSYSIHLRVPRGILAEDSIVETDGVVTSARIDEEKLSDKMREDIYLMGFIDSALGALRNFDSGDGKLNGLAATYFCSDFSGVDILADIETQKMIEYDARKSKWYVEAAKLGPGEVYWTDPVLDASGRGLAVICSMPVYVDGKFVGVAGTGGSLGNISDIIDSTNVGSEGYAFMVNYGSANGVTVMMCGNTDPELEINKCASDLRTSDNKELLAAVDKIAEGGSEVMQVTIDGRPSYIAFAPVTVTNFSVVIALPLDDSSINKPIDELRSNIDGNTSGTISNIGDNITRIILLFLMIVVVAFAAVLLFSNKFARKITKPIELLTEGAERVSGGDLDFKLDVKTGDELEILGSAFNSMTMSLTEYIENLSRITAEKERIGAELNVATKIQASMLPCIFPPFPERDEFDIFASMTPAKEVGGDFYDFFLIDSDHLALVMADVSGKGVPAALFMVIAKTLIKNVTQMGNIPVNEVLQRVNDQLCESNDANMFVTTWLGVLEISTGKMSAVNAGHEFPVIKRKDGEFELYKDKHGFVLAGMEGVRYRGYEFELGRGDELFLYTDGVPEATDENQELFGTDRMLEVLNENKDASVKELLPNVKKGIDKFVGNAEQFDDITMLALKIN